MERESGGIGRRRLLGLTGAGLGALAASGLLAACAPPRREEDGGGQGGASPEKVTLALPSSLSSLDVGRESGTLNYAVACLVQEGLLSVSPDGELRPGLAARWSQPDERTYVFTLRRGVTFSDGTPLTPDDVVASVEAIRDPKNTNALAYLYAHVTSVKVTGDLEVTVRLKKPDALFLWTVSPSGLLVSSRAFLKRHRGEVGTGKTLLLGTGAYRITGFAADDHVLLERNDAWWGEKPGVRTLKLDFVPDAGTRLVAMKSGAVDGALGLASDEARGWESAAEVTYTEDRSVVALAFDTGKAPFDDPRVRRAVAHAADRAGMAEGILHGKAQVAAALPSPGMWGDLLPAEQVAAAYDRIALPAHDLAAARKELAASGHPDGFTAELHYPGSGPQLGKAALALAAELKKIGVTLKVEEITLEQWIAELGSGKFPLQFLWYFPTTGDPAELLDAYLHGEAEATNIARYDQAKVTGALKAATTETDSGKRGALLLEAVTEAAGDLPYLPLWWASTATALSGRLALGGGDGPFALTGPWAARLRSS
ncbi:ABC transporter substrate-binding protein [Streptomyces albidoflavus]|uniref:ABC transporter substrate-binding protein n=1 Tax=Streptomyces albidoflavus TaxID=1886 RepID=UPI0033F1E0AE